MFDNMADILLKSIGLTPEKVKEYSEGILKGIETNNLNVGTILHILVSVESRLNAIEIELQRQALRNPAPLSTEEEKCLISPQSIPQ